MVGRISENVIMLLITCWSEPFFFKWIIIIGKCTTWKCEKDLCLWPLIPQKKKKKSFQYAHTLGLNYDKVGSMMLSSLELKFLIMNLIMKLACKSLYDAECIKSECKAQIWSVWQKILAVFGILLFDKVDW